MIFAGYDPGGNGKHGVALIVAEGGCPVSACCTHVETTEAAIRWFSGQSESLTAIGVDTLTCWSTGPSGWRPADRWLKERYPEVRRSVASPNSLYGSMSVNGMALLVALKAAHPQLLITETHPKVLHWQMEQRPYDFVSNQALMLEILTEQIGFRVDCSSDHDWDAMLSALAALRGVFGQWHRDLHLLPTARDERLVMPCGDTKYFWPE